LRDFLLDPGSLTKKLQTASGGRFEVEVIRQELALPSRSEARLLGIPRRQRALIREVYLRGRNTRWVFARSIIPLATMTGRLRTLRQLDNRPLGALLFSDSTMTRDPMEIGHFTPGDRSKALCDIHDRIWGRRSLFYLDSKPLLVSEFFLPAFKP